MSGQPSVEKGQSAELNQVSSTSGSWVMFLEWQHSHSVASSFETVTCPQSSQYQAGMRWPHQSWREMHQSRTLYIQFRYVFEKRSGTNLTSPSSTTRMASLARGFILTNHWSE